MNSNKFVYSVIAVLISVVFIGSCLAPVVMDAVTGDKQTITLSNDDTGATTFVYKLAAADSIVGNISTGEYTITAGGTDYTTTTDSLLISPDEGIIAPDIQNGKIVIYSSEGVTEELPIEKITKVVASNKTTWILTEDGHVYGCGEKGGKQSSGDNLNVIVFTDRTPADKVVTQVACTTGDTWIVTQDGRVYGCGGGSYGQQGSGETNSVSIFTDRTPADKVVTQVACSGETTWIVTQDGHVYGCGRNQEGQQGSGDNNNITVFTDRTPADKVVTQVACSISTTLLLTQDGKVYGSGSYNGKTSSNNQFIDSTPTDKIVTKIACAKYNSWIVTQDGKAYASANNSYGQGGTGTAGIISTFTDVTPADKVVTQVACSDETSWIVTQDGHVFGCGRSTRGQQGTADTANITIFTDRTPADKVVTQVACSDSTTWFVTQDGHVFGCGYNYYGEQGSNTSGSGTDVTTFTDRTPADKVVTQVACSANTTWIVTQDGRVLGCGYNNDGQQGSNTSGSGTDVTTFTDRTPELPTSTYI